MGLNVAVLANLKDNAPGYPGPHPHAWDELDSESTVNGIIAALEAGGHRATFLEGNLRHTLLRQAQADHHRLLHFHTPVNGDRTARSRACREGMPGRNNFILLQAALDIWPDTAHIHRAHPASALI